MVERRRRLAKEVLSGSHVPIEASANAVQPEEDTDAHDSEDPDIFSRKAKFEALQKKFQKHQKEKGLLLKGNDLRTNIYIKKMEKLARHDMGLDVIGYKDYVNNLKSFAKYHDDLSVFALDNIEKMDDGSGKGKMDYLVEIRTADWDEDKSTGIERAKKNVAKVQVSLAKCLRANIQYINAADERALEDLVDNFESYAAVSMSLVDQVSRFYKLHTFEKMKRDGWDDLEVQLHAITPEILEDAEVSKRQFEQIKMLMKLDRDILNPMGKRHERWIKSQNSYNNFVDFTKLPKNLTKEHKALLFRPKKMKELAECYRELAIRVKTNTYRRYEHEWDLKYKRFKLLNWDKKLRLKKPIHEYEVADRLWERIDKFMKSKSIET